MRIFLFLFLFLTSLQSYTQLKSPINFELGLQLSGGSFYESGADDFNFIRQSVSTWNDPYYYGGGSGTILRNSYFEFGVKAYQRVISNWKLVGGAYLINMNELLRNRSDDLLYIRYSESDTEQRYAKVNRIQSTTNILRFPVGLEYDITPFTRDKDLMFTLGSSIDFFYVFRRNSTVDFTEENATVTEAEVLQLFNDPSQFFIQWTVFEAGMRTYNSPKLNWGIGFSTGTTITRYNNLLTKPDGFFNVNLNFFIPVKVSGNDE